MSNENMKIVRESEREREGKRENENARGKRSRKMP